MNVRDFITVLLYSLSRKQYMKNFLCLDGYTTDDISYLWDAADPVQLAQNLNLPRFNIEKYSSSYCNVKTNTGKVSKEHLT